MPDGARTLGLDQFLKGRVCEAKLSVTRLQDFDLCSGDRKCHIVVKKFESLKSWRAFSTVCFDNIPILHISPPFSFPNGLCKYNNLFILGWTGYTMLATSFLAALRVCYSKVIYLCA